MLGVLLATGVIFVVGVLDDFRDMSAPAKVAGQFLAASILYFSGATMYQLKLPFAGFIVLGPSILPIITAVWVFALCNAINLIDGLDGLAAGIVAIASGTLVRLRTAPRGPRAAARDQRRAAHRRPDVWHLHRLPARQLSPREALHG